MIEKSTSITLPKSNGMLGHNESISAAKIEFYPRNSTNHISEVSS